ncbi:MAG: adenosylmethionine--8-amino-7-oxononanoate transaminase [Planctomycetota bacterium]|nr:adenosylmethionine--8-amino-7-oxononanoate transaminase [Planctomycetota bacterium]
MTTTSDSSGALPRHLLPEDKRESMEESVRNHDQWRAIDREVLWHPFTQMSGWMDESFPVIERAEGSELIDVDGVRYLDGVSSLWCSIHGHGVAEVDQAIKDQLDQVAHSTLLGLSSVSAIRLAEALVDVTPRNLSRVFYSDSGSTAVEVALKMAFQYWRQKEGETSKRSRFLCFQGSYHGDTIGSVSVGGMDLFHQIFSPLLFSVTHLPVPEGPSTQARDAKVDQCLSEIDRVLEQGDQYAALVMEPGVQGAAGIRPYPEGFTAEVCRRAREAGLLVILDEVATGFGRSGHLLACEREGIEPDLLCLAKGLSAGYLPLAATLASERIYEGFLGAHEEYRTFFHGHTFTGNALACAAALASVRLCLRPDFLERCRSLGDDLEACLEPLRSHPNVLEVRRYGSMFGIELVQECGAPEGERGPKPRSFEESLRMGHRVIEEARHRGAILRPLGDTVVLMPPLSMAMNEITRLAEITIAAIGAAVGRG